MALPVHMTSLPRLVARSLAALCRRGSGDRTDQTQARAILEELEPRILYSADSPVALFGDAMVMVAADPRAPSAAAPSAPGAQPASTQVQEIVFIDTRVPDYQVLVDDLLSKNDASRQFEIFVLDPNLDGVEQIGQVLAQRHNISALHIISHGSDGNVALGNGALNFDTLLKQANQIKSWGDALTEDGDMLIYGCDVAATLDGQALLKALSRLTGADVAASDDLTGNKLLGGDWDLEFNAGTIETSIAVSQSS